jgi:hypothetical protein
LNQQQQQGESMKFEIEFYNTAASIAWAIAVFLIAGMAINRKRRP